MKLLNPWFMILIFGSCVFLLGKYFQLQEQSEANRKGRKREMPDFVILSVSTHAEPSADAAKLDQWADITIRVPKGFDVVKNGAALLVKIQAAANLIGAPEK
jgi:hypothetical protein